jgi:hypothetical protein
MAVLQLSGSIITDDVAIAAMSVREPRRTAATPRGAGPCPDARQERPPSARPRCLKR